MRHQRVPRAGGAACERAAGQCPPLDGTIVDFGGLRDVD
jgi:hypothetical protein